VIKHIYKFVFLVYHVSIKHSKIYIVI